MRSPRTNLIFGLLFGLILVSLVSQVDLKAAPPATESLADLVAQRLNLGKEVAWKKANLGLPIYDPAREHQIIAELTEQADIARVDHERAKRFFTAQISASRALQNEMIDRWHHGGRQPPNKPLNLVTEIRPKIDAIDGRILLVLREALADGHLVTPAQLQAQLQSDGFSATVAHLAATGLARQ